MDPDTEVDFDFLPFLVRYKSGRIHRLMGTSRVDVGTDVATGVTCKDVVIDANAGLAARLYLPKDVPRSKKLPVLVYFHGGAFAVHLAFSATHHRFLNALVAADVVVVSVDYRLAPEHTLPAAYDDTWAALGWALASCAPSVGREPWLAAHGDPARVFVAGDSAGANIAHNMATRAGGRENGLPAGARIEGLVLLHPYFREKDLVPSEGADPRFLQRVERSWGFICTGRYGTMPTEKWAALGCRRALVTVAELDTMRDRGRRYVEALRGSAWTGEEAVLPRGASAKYAPLLADGWVHPDVRVPGLTWHTTKYAVRTRRVEPGLWLQPQGPY